MPMNLTNTRTRGWILVLALTAVFSLLAASLATAGITDVVKSKRVSGAWKWRGGNGGNFAGETHSYINNGDKVRWKVPASQGAWHDVHSHNQYANWSYSRDRIDPGERATRTFNNDGNYGYRCVRHSAMIDGDCQGMCGQVHVS
jgi:plastocyanin